MIRNTSDHRLNIVDIIARFDPAKVPENRRGIANVYRNVALTTVLATDRGHNRDQALSHLQQAQAAVCSAEYPDGLQSVPEHYDGVSTELSA